MSKSKKPAKNRDIPALRAPGPAPQAKNAAAPPAPKSHAFRETVESIVIAFVLAFLFRTFEAEAFVIPTGSMAPTLMGRHKDVDCPKCGYRYQVSASEEAPDNQNQRPSANVAGMCPMCRYVLPMVTNDQLPLGAAERTQPDITPQRSYNGDRILVNKYIYTFSDPERWDVVVFKFPGDAKVNYIKRLVGLPGEKLRIYQGDLFVGDENATQDTDFEIARKPEEKVLAMRQLVHDTNYDPAELDAAGWPLRWSASSDDANGWKVEKTLEGNRVQQTFNVDSNTDDEAWLHYTHFTPDYDVWQSIADAELKGTEPQLPEARPRLITDANPYNGREDQSHLNNPYRFVASRDSLEVDRLRQGIHWVGDLMVEADVQVEAARGELILQLVEAGKPFRCTIDLTTGKATLSAAKVEGYAPTASTPLKAPGKYHIAFANFDDQLLLWVNGDLVSFDARTTYNVNQVFGKRSQIKPATDDNDPGDLAPARIGARDAKLSVSRLQVWRDIYYIADKAGIDPSRPSNLISDFPISDWGSLVAMSYDPSLWSLFANRRYVDFPLGKDQFFVMGDNSAESSDARLWDGSPDRNGQIHGQHLDRRLLIGKALSVYWPHSWNRIPGTPIPFPLFPNVEDMRLVR